MDPLTKIIAAHRWAGIYETCECFKPWDFDADTMGRDEHDAHVAAAIHADRTITTDEELDALPDGAVVLDADGDVMEADTNCDRRIWYTPGREWEWVGNDYTHLPARVLYRPDEDGQ